MSDDSILSDLDGDGHRGRHGSGGRGGCLPRLIIGLVVLAVLAFAGVKGFGWVKDKLSGPPDYAGPGSGHVAFTVAKGESIPEMGRALVKLHVVKSSQAFVDAASRNSRATGIQPGTYRLKRQMKAADAVAVIVDPKQMSQHLVTIPEGTRESKVVDLVAEHTHFSKAALEKVLAHPKGLGLPSYAHGNAEGYLFPATYDVTPGETPQALLRSMVRKWRQEADSIHLERAAKKVNLDPDQAMVVASMLEFEARRSQDYPKVARAIYNRLGKGMKIQSDATVAYANGLSGTVWTTSSQRAIRSPYNTYLHAGLPPGPIGNPGLETIKAALHPAKGPWLYWVVVNLKTGETVFSTTGAQHERATERLKEYCSHSDAC